MNKLGRALILLLMVAILWSPGLGPDATTLASRIAGEQPAAPASPALAARSPTLDPVNGFPLWYRDSAGLVLTLCVGDLDTFCFFTDPPIPGNAFSQQIGFGDNAFYWRARADLNAGRNGNPADLELALKAAFANGPPVNPQPPQPPEQIVLGRVRVRATGLEQNTAYVVTHPFGVDNLTTDNNGDINFTEDIGCILDKVATIPCDFNLALASRVGPFLTAESPAPPAGFIGNPRIDQTVKGSPLGTNFFRIVGANAGGQGLDTVQTSLFQLQGKKLNTAPMAVNDTATVAQNSTSNPINVLANDSDPEGNPISVTAVTQGANGAVAIPAGGANVLYTPAGGFGGVDTFTYTISDGALTASATVTVTVDRAPTAVNDAVTVLAGSVDNPVNVLANDGDPDGNPISVTAVNPGANGATALGTGGANVLYTPSGGFVGADAFTYTISDGFLTATATVSVTVLQSNRPPVASGDLATVAQNSTNNPINVLANDSDPDGNPIIVTAVGAALNGTPSVPPGGASVLYTPNPGFAGSDAFTYTLSDGSLTATGNVTITVAAAAANRPPVAAGDAVTVTQNSITNTISVLANDSDPDGNPLSVTSTVPALNGTSAVGPGGGSVLYRPNAGFTGSDTFGYTLSDGSLTATGTVTVTVSATASNRPPVASNDATSVTQGSANNPINVLANDSDPDGNPLSVASVGSALNGTSAVSPSSAGVLYTPSAGFVGADTFSYTISDGAITSTATVTVDVRRAANRAPVGAADAVTVTQGSANNRINVLTNDSDPDGDSIRITDPGQSANGVVSIGPGGANLLYTPNPTFGGVDSFTYTISDGSLTATAAVTVTARGMAIYLPLSIKGPVSGW